MQNITSVLDVARSATPTSRREQLLTCVRAVVLAGSAAALIGAGVLALPGFVGGGIVMMNTEREEARLQLGNALVSLALTVATVAPVLHQNARLNCALRGSQVTSC